MADKVLPAQDQLRQLLYYSPETGQLIWKARKPELFSDGGNRTAEAECDRWNRRHAGRQAMAVINSYGYLRGKILGREYLAHRVIWKIQTGNEPLQIDHINGITADNRWDNLRQVSAQENHLNMAIPKNNLSGVAGVRFWERDQKWIAQIGGGNRRKFLGSFTTFEEAVAARKDAELKLGYHSNHGRKRECRSSTA